MLEEGQKKKNAPCATAMMNELLGLKKTNFFISFTYDFKKITIFIL